MGREDPADPYSLTLDDFEPFSMEKPPLVYPGLYAFLDGDKVVYVGESGNVPCRLKQHRRKKWYKEGLEVRALWCADDEQRLIAETIIILKARPRENKAIKLGIAKKTGAIYALNFLRSSRTG